MAAPLPSPSSPGEIHFNTITTFFNTTPHLTQHIEFLPSSSSPRILISGLNIGIPKPLLILAFQHARRLFFTSVSVSVSAYCTPTDRSKELFDSSLIMLLVASECHTAVNVRKKLLLEAGGGGGGGLVGQELRFLESLLTSPLNKCNKSPVLWTHRQWLIERFVAVGGGGGGDGVVGLHLERELEEVVRRAAEVHPMNYYAWNYARFITTYFYTLQPTLTQESTPSIKECIEKQLSFCFLHVSDTSGWSFLLFLFSFFVSRSSASSSFSVGNPPSLTPTTTHIQIALQDYLAEKIKEVMNFAHTTAPGGESMWVFLRTVLASGRLLGDGERRAGLIGLLEGWVGDEKEEEEEGVRKGGCEERVREGLLEGRALRWVKRNYGRD